MIISQISIPPVAGGLKGTPSLRAPRLRVCMISDDFLPAATGVGIHVQIVSAELARRGHHVSIITTRRPGQPEHELWKGVRVYRMFSLKIYGFWQALTRAATLRAVLRNIRPDIVHYHYLSFLMKKARRISAELGARNVYTYHMTADHLTQQLFMRPFRGLIAQDIVRFCNGCDLVVSPSERLAGRISQGGVSAPVAYVSNPVDFGPVSTASARQEKRGFTVLFVGRLAPEKNLPLLLNAFALLTRERRDAELWIAGQGGERGRLERLACELGIAARVRFLGQLDRDRLATCYAAADVFVLPSLVECQPIVAIEAMTQGLPLLLSERIVCARELVEENANGYLVDAERPGELARRLRDLAGDPELRKRMGEAGRSRAATYKPERVVQLLIDHYRRTLCGTTV